MVFVASKDNDRAILYGGLYNHRKDKALNSNKTLAAVVVFRFFCHTSRHRSGEDCQTLCGTTRHGRIRCRISCLRPQFGGRLNPLPCARRVGAGISNPTPLRGVSVVQGPQPGKPILDLVNPPIYAAW